MATLYGIAQSPWTERARWALDHHRVAYAYHEHIPLLGEPLLRRAARKGGLSEDQPATVPLLVDGSVVATSSTAIARHAERVGRGASLFPAGKDVLRWDDLSQKMAEVGRAWLLRNLSRDRGAQREAVPWVVPGLLKGALAPSAALGAAFLRKKHAVVEDVDAAVARVLVPALQEVRRALGGGSYLEGAFSWADVCIATSLQAVRPHAKAPFGPATHAAWTNEELAREFDDLLMWRDAIVAKHR